MKYRVHRFVLVRVERELEAETPEEAAGRAFAVDQDLDGRLGASGLEYAGRFDEVCLVDPLTDGVGSDGRLLPDDEWSQWLRVTEVRQPDGTRQAVVTPAVDVPENYASAAEAARCRTQETVAGAPLVLLPAPIDWTALAHQKRWLLRQADPSEEALGLVHLLDALQDAAVAGGVPEAFVFPPLDPGEPDDGHLSGDHGQ
jgi:hypothetical protein